MTHAQLYSHAKLPAHRLSLIPRDSSYRLNLDGEIARQPADFNSGSGGLWIWQQFRVDLIHGRVIGHICEVNSSLEHVVP